MIDKKNLYKTISLSVTDSAITQHKVSLLGDDKVVHFSSTQKFRPKNRKQKKGYKEDGFIYQEN